jgi:hypothetical protein
MIRWWRPDGGTGTADRWTQAWCRRWATEHLAPGRGCTVFRGCLDESPVPRLLDRFTAGDIGHRFVLGLVVPASRYPAAGLGSALDRAGLLPEVLHGADPFPGDARLAGEGDAGRERDGEFGLGCVLVRRPSSARALAGLFDILPGPHPYARWAGLSVSEVPLPLPPGRWTGSDLARAYSADSAGFAVLALDLVVAGAVVPVPPERD